MDRREAVGGIVGAVGACSALLLLGGCKGNQRFTPLPEGWNKEPVGPPLDRDVARRPAPEPAPATSGVIPRRGWTSDGPIMALANPMGPISRITIHHDAMNSGSVRSRDEAARRLQQIRRAHLGNQWADIGYHYVIDPSGRIWEGRPITLQGAHVRFNNENNMGIMVMGNFEEQRPSSAALASLDGFLTAQMRRHRVAVGRVFTHRELGPTACPGRNLQAFMDSERRGGGALARA